jgi:hypothetical protein
MTDVRITGEYVEAATPQNPARRLNELYIEAVTFSSITPRVLSGFMIEATTATAAPRHVKAMYIEVLTPSQLVFPFKGWGTPI